MWFFNSLLGELDLTVEAKTDLRRLVDAKPPFHSGVLRGLEKSQLCAVFAISAALRRRGDIRRSRRGSGGNSEALQALGYVKNLHRLLTEAGFADDIIIDLGIVHEIDYYTGAVLRGYALGAGEPILSGGRYDGLLASFGYNVPATGFAINVGLVAECMAKAEERGQIDARPTCYTLSGGEFAAAAAKAGGLPGAASAADCPALPSRRSRGAMRRRAGLRGGDCAVIRLALSKGRIGEAEAVKLLSPPAMTAPDMDEEKRGRRLIFHTDGGELEIVLAKAGDVLLMSATACATRA